MSSVDTSERLLDGADAQLETAPTLVDFVRDVNSDLFLRDTDHERFEILTYVAGPIVRALFCRELARLSWNGLYKYLSTDARAVRIGFDPEKFGKYNTAPTRQTLTTAWETELSDGAKRSILAVSEHLVTIANENENRRFSRWCRPIEEPSKRGVRLDHSAGEEERSVLILGSAQRLGW